jgi:Fe-S-cluster containining protein
MDIKTKLAVLTILYSIYEDFVSNLTLACEKYCALCCTRGVTLTTIEGYMILEHLVSKGKSDLLEKISAAASEKRFQPKITTNGLADLCVQGKDIPDEETGDRWGSCPLLVNDECPIYKVRPFACRCMVSSKNCHETGYAEVDSFVISGNNLFFQTIENIDSPGLSGNLTDVLLFLESEDNRKYYRDHNLEKKSIELIPNHPVKSLMIPPEHRVRIKSIIDKIGRINVPGSSKL